MKDYQCLLFLVPKVKIKNSKKRVNYSDRNHFEGFILLRSSLFKGCPLLLQLLAHNNVEIINNQECLPLQHALHYGQVEVVELVIEGWNQGPENFPLMEISRFHIHVDKGNEEIVRLMLGRGSIVSTCDDDSNSWNAVDIENSAAVECILTRRSDISFRCPSGGTLLHLAVMRKDKNLVKLLLKHNANVNAKDYNLATGLDLAMEHGNIPMVKLLIKNGANINDRRKDGFTSLIYAIEHGQLEIIRLLLKNGADVNMTANSGITPLHLASILDRIEIVNLLIENGAFVDATMTYCHTEGITPLCFAVDEEHSTIVKRLLECGANVDSLGYDGQTVLGLAVDDGKLEIIEALLKHHPDVNNKMNQRALYESVCRDGKIPDKIVKMLLEHGFIIGGQHANDSKLLHQAICKNYLEIVTQLLDLGANINKLYRFYDTEDDFFRKTTPLVTAIRFSTKDIIQLLVERGADVNAEITLEETATPLSEAIISRKPEALEILLADDAGFHLDVRSEESEKLICLALECNSLGLIECLVNKGVDMNCTIQKSTHPIVVAARKNSLEMVQLLVRSGASVESRDSGGQTALLAATRAEDNRLDIVKFLVLNNADIEARYFSLGTTAISNAVCNGDLSVVDEFLKLGARIDRTACNGESPLNFAVALGHSEIFSALLDHSFADKELVKKTNICVLFTFSFMNTIRIIKDFGLPDFNWLIHHFDRSRERFFEAAKILARHVIKTEAAFSSQHSCSSPVMSDNELLMIQLEGRNFLPSWYQNASERNNFLNECKAEIAQLKSNQVGGASIRYYDILTGNLKQLSCFVKNADITRALNSKDYKTKFPIYTSVISCQFRKGIQRRNLLNGAIQKFHRLFRQFKELPRNLKEDMLNYLNNKDLQILIYTCTHTDAQSLL